MTVSGGPNVTSGVAGITFGATTLSGAPTFNIVNSLAAVPTLLTLGAVTNTGSSTATIIGNGNFVRRACGDAGGIYLGVSGGPLFNGIATLNQANTFAGGLTIYSGTASGTLADSFGARFHYPGRYHRRQRCHLDQRGSVTSPIRSRSKPARPGP